MRIVFFFSLVLNLVNGYSFNEQKIIGTWVSESGVIFDFYNNKIKTNLNLGTIGYKLSKKTLEIKLDKTLFLFNNNNPNYLKKNKLKFKIVDFTEDTLTLLPLNKISGEIIFNKKKKTYFKKIDKVDFKPSNYDSISFLFSCNIGEKVINNILIIDSKGNIKINDNNIYLQETQSFLKEKMINEFDEIFKNDFNKYYFIYENSTTIITSIHVKKIQYKMICTLKSSPKSMLLFIKKIFYQISPHLLKIVSCNL